MLQAVGVQRLIRIIHRVPLETAQESLQSHRVDILRADAGTLRTFSDAVALEEPLEIRLDVPQARGRALRSLTITMRTPGHDEELAAGFLFTEGIVRHPSDIADIRPCGTDDGVHGAHNAVRVRIADHARVEWPSLERHFYATSSCGVCGKSSLEALRVKGLAPPARDTLRMDLHRVTTLPDRVRAAQRVFEQTGGLHAAALLDARCELSAIREDVGRHNAVDKLLGQAFLSGSTALSDQLLFLSGRASFELMQKALVAGLPMVVAVGAPSSLAVDLARRFDMTLVGFVRGERFNVYHGAWRLGADAA